MGALAKHGEGDGLSEQQRRFVEALLNGEEAEEAKRRAGYSESTPTVSILRRKVVENAIRAGVDAELSGPLRVKAMIRLRQLITNDKTPAATAFGAAKLIIERGDDKAAGEKPLSEMTESELMAVVERARQAVAETSPIIDVTPDNGAQQGRSEP